MSMTRSRGEVTAAHYRSPAVALLEGMEGGGRDIRQMHRGAFGVFEEFFALALSAIESKPGNSMKEICVLGIAQKAATEKRGNAPNLAELGEKIRKYQEVLEKVSQGKYGEVSVYRRCQFCDFLSRLIAAGSY